MDEVSHEYSEQTEIATQETASPQSEAPKPVDEQEEKNARNWRRANEKRKHLEKELKRRDDQIEELIRAVSKPQTPETPEVDEFDGIGDEDFIPKGKISQLVKRETKNIREEAKKEVEQVLRKREQARWKERIEKRYPDFEDVVNLDTLDLLEQEDPEMAESIAELKDPYKVGLQTYKFIKASGLSDRVGSMKRGREVETKIEENAKTVQSPQVYDKRPLAQAYKMTSAEKTSLYAEMMSAASQVSGY
mgnify:CR=1 FL=1